MVSRNMDFVGRTEELAALRRSWNSPRGEFFVLYGRRRVGKSVLLSQFATEVDRVVFFEAMPTETRDNLTALATELDRLIDDPLSSPIDSWQAAFAAIGRLADSAPLLIVIDEFQYVARKEPAVGSLINRLIESRADQSNLMLVVSGSDVSFFHHEVMGYAATTYGRRTAALKLRPFEFSEAQAFMPNLNLAERVRAYAVFGGMPYYLRGLRTHDELPAAILEEVLLPGARLQEEPRFLFSQEGRIRD